MLRSRELRLDAFLPYRLSITSNLVSDHIASAYQQLFGLTIPEWRLIAIVAEEGAVAQSAVASAAGWTRSPSRARRSRWSGAACRPYGA
jgi:hypothetical protein